MKKMLLVLGFVATLSLSYGDVTRAEEQTAVTDEIVAIETVVDESSIAQENEIESQAATRASYQNVYRVYNPNSGAHFYTARSAERNALLNVGWVNEGTAWQSPVGTGSPIHRFYNPNSGEHLFTLNRNEAAGWNYEGVVFNAGSGKSSVTPTAVYRLFNPNTNGAASHHYTKNYAEVQMLVNLGWRNEGVKFWVR